MSRRFAPRNDMQKFAGCLRLPEGTAGKRPCSRSNASSFSMSLRASAHTGVAIRVPQKYLAVGKYLRQIRRSDEFTGVYYAPSKMALICRISARAEGLRS